MRILVDMDQVLAQWAERFLEWFNHDKGTSHTMDDLLHWDMGVNLDLDNDDYMRSIMRCPEFWDLNPVPGAIEGMKALIDAGHDVLIVSAVPRCAAGAAYHGKLQWIRKHMPFFNLDNFMAVQRKDLIEGDILIDDNVKNIENFLKKGKKTIVAHYMWNRNCVASKRAYDWDEIIQDVKGL